MAQYHAHVNRLKEAINEPAQASFASEATNAGSTDASEVIANLEAQLVGEAASHAAAAPAETQRPPAAMFNPPVPNSTRYALCVHWSAICICLLLTDGIRHTQAQATLIPPDSLHFLETKAL